jgi:protoporphyrinogen oxidase
MSGKPEKVVIIGAGPAGLTAGLGLAEAGVQVEILEAEERVGGLCASIPFSNCYFDLGGHRFITKDAEVQKFIEDTMGDELLTRPRKSVIFLKGKALGYPVKASDILLKLGPLFSANAFADYFFTYALQRLYPRSDSSFEQWVINRFGATLYNLYFGPYSEKLWGLKPCQISHKWAHQRIKLLNLWDVLLKMFLKGDNPATYADRFYYPKKGIGQVSGIIADKITNKGGVIRLRHNVSELSMSGDRITKIVSSDAGGAPRESFADIFINTAPLTDLIRMMRPCPDELTLSTANKMDYRSIRFFNVCIDAERVTDNTWIYIPELKYVFFRIQELRNWSPTVVPDGKTALTLEIACDYEDNIWTMPDAELWELCRKALESLGILKDAKITGYFSSYAKHAYPVYHLDYDEKVSRLYRYIAGIKNLRSIGRQGLFRYNNMDHSLKMGLLTARHLTEGLPFKNVMSIATENEIFDWQDPGR